MKSEEAALAHIQIEGLKLFGKHGVFPEERATGQDYFIDIRLELDSFSGQDELSETVDYVAVIEEVKAVNRSNSFQLIETFAKALAERLIDKFAKVDSAKVRVRKMPDIDGVEFDWVAAEIFLTRDS